MKRKRKFRLNRLTQSPALEIHHEHTHQVGHLSDGCIDPAGMSACAVTRGQQSTGAYIDDSAITALVKSRFVENKDVDAAAISVETLNGTVMLSGFAKNANEKATAETIAKKVDGVKLVKNELAVRP